MDRVILHCDLNGFYASVESLFHPELEGLPMAVCGNPENRHGVILAKNELAKRQGVLTAETVWQAVRKCPDLRLVAPHHDQYRAYSRKVNAIYERFTDQVEPFGIDESWLDVTGSRHLFGDGKHIADTLRETVKRELGLTLSVGVSFNKIFAKLGSDYKKPDATTLISRENFQDILYPLPVSALLFVGNVTERRLESVGIRTIGDLAEADREGLQALLGSHGLMLSVYARGEDDDPVRRADEREEIKSVGNGITFRRNLIGDEDVRTGVMALSESVSARLRRHGLKCRGVQVAIKDPDLKTIDRQMPLQHPTWLTREIFSCAMAILSQHWDSRKPIRMLTVTAINLTSGGQDEQMSFFEAADRLEKWEALDQSLDKIREKFGKTAVRPASVLKNDIGIDL